jgi:polyisoprenoid-binding protein YceI
MSSAALQPFSGTFRAQPEASTFSFAVRHSGVFWFRGSLSDVAATLRGAGHDLALEGPRASSPSRWSSRPRCA